MQGSLQAQVDDTIVRSVLLAALALHEGVAAFLRNSSPVFFSSVDEHHILVL